MKWNISNDQVILLGVGTFLFAYCGFLTRPVIYCIRAPCPQPSAWPSIIMTAVIGAILIYVVEIVYNYLRNDSHLK